VEVLADSVTVHGGVFGVLPKVPVSKPSAKATEFLPNGGIEFMPGPLWPRTAFSESSVLSLIMPEMSLIPNTSEDSFFANTLTPLNIVATMAAATTSANNCPKFLFTFIPPSYN
jgi:hypothetical protein